MGETSEGVKPETFFEEPSKLRSLPVKDKRRFLKSEGWRDKARSLSKSGAILSSREAVSSTEIEGVRRA